MQLTSTSEAELFTVSEKLPSKSVEAPLEVPTSITVAPTTGPSSSETVPLT